MPPLIGTSIVTAGIVMRSSSTPIGIRPCARPYQAESTSAAPTTIRPEASTPATVRCTQPAESSNAATPAPISSRLIVTGVRNGRGRGRRTRGGTGGGPGHGACWVHALVVGGCGGTGSDGGRGNAGGGDAVLAGSDSRLDGTGLDGTGLDRSGIGGVAGTGGASARSSSGLRNRSTAAPPAMRSS